MPASAPEKSPSETLDEWPDVHSSLPEYAARFPGALGQWILKTQTNTLLQAIDIQPNPSLRGAYDSVDVGGGHGQVTPVLLELKRCVATVVSDARATNTLTRILGQLTPTCTEHFNLIVAPLDELPFEPRSIPLAISLRMVCHIPQWHGFIEELCRVASSQVIIDYPSLQSANYFQHLFFKAKLKVEGNTRSFTVFDDREIAAQFRRCGFSNIRLYRQFTLPLALHRALKRPEVSGLVESIFARVGLTHQIGSPVILSATR